MIERRAGRRRGDEEPECRNRTVDDRRSNSLRHLLRRRQSVACAWKLPWPRQPWLTLGTGPNVLSWHFSEVPARPRNVRC